MKEKNNTGFDFGEGIIKMGKKNKHFFKLHFQPFSGSEDSLHVDRS
jgi:hypothetical protein